MQSRYNSSPEQTAFEENRRWFR